MGLLPQFSTSDPVVTTTIMAATPAPTTSKPFDCEKQGLWSMAQKNYCCQNYGVGCPTTPPPRPAPAPPAPPPAAPPPAQPTQPPPPNCAIGAPNTWAMGKKVWCCL